MLDELLSDMFDISCIESYHFYHHKNDPVCEGEIDLIKETKNDVINKIKDNLFENCYGDTKSITYQELFNLFKENYNEGVKFFFIFLFTF